jgi:hypothetical protein
MTHFTSLFRKLSLSAASRTLAAGALLVACTEGAGTKESTAAVGERGDAQAPVTNGKGDSGSPRSWPRRDASVQPLSDSGPAAGGGSNQMTDPGTCGPSDASVGSIDANVPIESEPFEELEVIDLDKVCGGAYLDVLFPNQTFGKTFRCQSSSS